MRAEGGVIGAFDWGTIMAASERGELRLLMLGETPQSVAEMIGAEGFVYLATPYSRRAVDRLGRWSLGQSGQLEAEASREVGRLKAAGVSAFSPIAASASVVHATLNPFSIYPKPDPAHDPLDAAAWLSWCLPFLAAARAVVVPDLAGWDQSDGIRVEVAEALRRDLPVMLYAGGDFGGAA